MVLKKARQYVCTYSGSDITDGQTNEVKLKFPLGLMSAGGPFAEGQGVRLPPFQNPPNRTPMLGVPALRPKQPQAKRAAGFRVSNGPMLRRNPRVTEFAGIHAAFALAPVARPIPIERHGGALRQMRLDLAGGCIVRLALQKGSG